MHDSSNSIRNYSCYSHPGCLTVLYYNARSLYPKLDELVSLTSLHNPGIICITETWLSGDIRDSEISLPNYATVRHDRNRHGGGVLFFIHNSLSYKIITRSPTLEFMLLCIEPNNFCTSKLHIGLFYRAPSSAVQVMDDFYNYLQSLDVSYFSNLIILGDFNIDFCNAHHPLYSKLSAILQAFSLTQVVKNCTHTAPTGKESMIDLALVSSETQVVCCETVPPLANSDHNGILLQWKWRITKGVKTAPRPIWRYAQADFELANQLLSECDWDELLESDSVDQCLEAWNEYFMSVMETCIPKGTLPKKKNLPWLTKNLTRAMRKRNWLFRRAKNAGPAQAQWKSKYKIARNKALTMLRKEKQAYFDKNVNNVNNKEFWKTIKFLNKGSVSIPTLVDDEHDKAIEDQDKANMLSSFFSKCFNTSLPPLFNANSTPVSGVCDAASPDNPDDRPEELFCTEEEVLKLLQSIDTSKANGPDKISGKMLKATANTIAYPIAKLFNKSIMNCTFPTCWKDSFIVPIPKSNNHSSPSNYRPVSLLSILSKLLEKHIYGVLFRSVEPISNYQWGFQAGKSTVTALLETTHNWLQLLESGCEVGAIFFDFKKAFDSVPHRALIQKLEGLGVNTYLLRWIVSYLTNRKQQVVVNGATSLPADVLSGVPQGSVLGPLLFLIYINDVCSVDLSSDCRLTMYADDILMFKPIKCIEDYRVFQKDIDSISDWVNVNYLQFNIQKCKFMLVSRKRNRSFQPDLLLCGQPLQKVDTYKYLGLLVSSDLSWSEHIDSICSKARRLLGILYRRFYTHSNSDALFQLYLSLVRPHLEYGSSVWSPYRTGEIKALEDVQKFALRICRKSWDQSYQSLLELFEVPTLEDRRIYADLCTMFKIVHNMCYFPSDILCEHRATRTTRATFGRPPHLHFSCPNFHTTQFQKSFITRSIRAWNSLPLDLLHSSSLSSFKVNVWNHIIR